MERLTKFRAGVMLVLFVLVLGFFGFRLFDSQVVDAEENADNQSSYTGMMPVRAARGDILDRNGNVLVSNRAAYDLLFNNFVVLSADGTNQHLLNLIHLCRERNFTYNEHFPVTKTRPYEYTLDEMSLEWQGYFQAYLADMDLDSDITAPLLMQILRKSYRIPETWSDEDARLVIGLRYELALRSDITNLSYYVFINDATDEELAAIQELDIPGLMVEPTTVREYHTTYAAHILGYVGAMNEKQWEYYKNVDGYEMDDEVGQDGLEEAFEEQLHGVDGWRVDTVDRDGNIIRQYYEVEPRAGDNVEITIDLNLQMVAEDSLAKTMKALRAQEPGSDGADAEGAAVVVMNVKTGEVLACASYPTYDPATFFTNYEALEKGEFLPLYNRALLAAYPPGSTYKMVMAIAGIESGKITKYSEIVDEGVFTKYSSNEFMPTCLVYSASGVTHGSLDVMHALEQSCNYFFYVLGDWMDIDDIDAVAKGLGLGEPTGIELYENLGTRANPENKAAMYEGADTMWFAADQVLAAIGQSINRFTPMQLCSYVSALANRGDRYKATFLRRVISADYSELLEENHPVLLGSMPISDEAYEAYSEGMKLVTQSEDGTAYSVFGDYDIPVAAKTGTAEHGAAEGVSDHGALVCYAPADDPEIAIAVYGEQAGHGSRMGSVARDILDAYFNSDVASDVVANENRVG